MKTTKKLLAAAVTATLLATGVAAAAPAQAVQRGPAVVQASGLCDIFPWWPWPCA